MGLEPDTRVVVNRDADLRSLPLTPADFFLFSRVESLAGAHPPTVADVIAASGQPADSAGASLIKLIELGAVLVSASPEPSARQRPSTPKSNKDDELRRRARDRKRSLLTAQMRVVSGSVGSRPAAAAKPEPAPEPAPEPSEQESLPTPRNDQREAIAVASRSIWELVEPVAADDPRLEPNLALASERQRRILALRDQLRTVGHFEILGLEPVDDAKLVRRAYHVISRELHPDSYYGKELGSFRVLLDDLFRRARASYEFLLDASHRRTLVDVHEEQVRDERERQDQIDREARAAAQIADEEARRVAAEREAAAQAEAQVAREKRDRLRQGRIRERAMAERRAQADSNGKKAAIEREAGRYGAAATLFRMAHEQDSTNPDYEREWRECLGIARRKRAEANFNLGKQAQAVARWPEAARHFAEAAEADPSLRNLTEAAGAMAEIDAAQARSFAMAALETLQQALAREVKLDPHMVGHIHFACARAFLAAGQLATAREQADRAHTLLNNKQTRALLNSIKLT